MASKENQGLQLIRYSGLYWDIILSHQFLKDRIQENTCNAKTMLNAVVFFDGRQDLPFSGANIMNPNYHCNEKTQKYQSVWFFLCSIISNQFLLLFYLVLNINTISKEEIQEKEKQTHCSKKRTVWWRFKKSFEVRIYNGSLIRKGQGRLDGIEKLNINMNWVKKNCEHV